MTPLSVVTAPRPSPTWARFILLTITLGVSLILCVGNASAAEILIGSTTIPKYKDESDASGEVIGNGYKALHSGTVVTLEVYDSTEGTPSATSIELGIYSGATKPETLLAHCLDSSAVKKGEWLKCTGLSLAVTLGTKYWLTELPLGGSTQYEAINGGEPAYGAKTFTKLEASASGWTERAAKGPTPFVALGAEEEKPMETELAVKSLKAVEAITTELKAIKVVLESISTSTAATSGSTASSLTELKKIAGTEGVATHIESLQTALESKGFSEGKPLFVTGSSGGSGGGSGGSMELSSFGTSAQGNLSELKGDLETVGWCLIGTLLALSLAVFTFMLIRGRK